MSGGHYFVTGGFWRLISVVQTTGLPSLIINRSGNSVIVVCPPRLMPANPAPAEPTPVVDGCRKAGVSTEGLWILTLLTATSCFLKNPAVDWSASWLQEYCDRSEGKIRPKCFNGSLLRQTFGPRWAYIGTNILRQVWGDDCDVLTITPRAMLLAQDLLIEVRRKYERELVQAFRWLKGLEISAILPESERTGIQLPFPPLAF